MFAFDMNLKLDSRKYRLAFFFNTNLVQELLILRGILFHGFATIYCFSSKHIGGFLS